MIEMPNEQQTNIPNTCAETRSIAVPKWCVLALVALALAVGLPSIRGLFVGADDQWLLVRNVYVNHPSLAHAVELFATTHRDLYQPLPLLTFAIEFAAAKTFGLFDEGIEGGAGLFHLTNVLIHSLNALLVLLVIRRLDGRMVVAMTAATLFAIHPMQVEAVYWISGRMTLMSTFFALASLLSLAGIMQNKRAGLAVLTPILVACAMMSKVRVALPLVMLLLPFVLRQRPPARFWIVWCVSAVVTAVFVIINVAASAGADMFAGADDVWQGSRLVRCFLALAWYLQHAILPVGLAAWYPAPEIARWTDGATIAAVITVLGAAVLAAWSWKRSRVGPAGFAWFLLTIASTLPIIPARSTLAADRYMYFPIVGIAWLVAALLATAYRRLGASRGRLAGRCLFVPIGGIVGVLLIATSWHVGSFYRTDVTRARRVADLFPDEPMVWSRLGWAQHATRSIGPERFTEAIRSGERELESGHQRSAFSAHQLIGVCHLALGETDAALVSLRSAVKLEPQNAEALLRLGSAVERSGDRPGAMAQYEAAVAANPAYNPALLRLASSYRRIGRSVDAATLYRRALENYRFEAGATLGLAEIDLATGTTESASAAVERLTGLLKWAPEHVDARANLGVALFRLQRLDEAIAAYMQVIVIDPGHRVALRNLSGIGWGLAASGEYREAHRIAGFVEKDRDSAHYAGDSAPLAAATHALIALATGDHIKAIEHTKRLAALGAPAAEATSLLLAALQAYGIDHPDDPWTYYMAAQLLIAQGNPDAARQAVSLFVEFSTDTQWHSRARALIPTNGTP